MATGLVAIPSVYYKSFREKGGSGGREQIIPVTGTTLDAIPTVTERGGVPRTFILFLVLRQTYPQFREITIDVFLKWSKNKPGPNQRLTGS